MSSIDLYKAAIALPKMDAATQCLILNPRKCGNCMRWGLGLCQNSEKWSWTETNEDKGSDEWSCYLPTVEQIAIEAKAGIEHYEE